LFNPNPGILHTTRPVYTYQRLIAIGKPAAYAHLCDSPTDVCFRRVKKAVELPEHVVRVEGTRRDEDYPHRLASQH
jgi:hypothetical protein